jgi:hypothetical protein
MRSAILVLVALWPLGAARWIDTQITQSAKRNTVAAVSALRYQDWNKHFRSVGTQLGADTALLDLRTHLQWLNLRLTQREGTEELSRRMRRGGDLEGWRYATLNELRTMLVDFTGTADGSSRDIGTERALQTLLGGPLETVHNQTGWTRRATYGVVNQLDCIPVNFPPGEPPMPPSGCSGYTTHFVYMAEDAEDGKVGAIVEIQQGSQSNISDLGRFEGNAILLVIRGK